MGSTPNNVCPPPVSKMWPATVLETTNLGLYQRELYRAHFRERVAAGNASLFILPYAALGTFILPILYLTIPHVKRPWLYRTRFALYAFIVAFNLHEMGRSSSTNMAAAYAVGLFQSWGIIWIATVLIWMAPQFEAERIEKRPRAISAQAGGSSQAGNGHAGAPTSNGHAKTKNVVAAENSQAAAAPDEDVAGNLAEYEYYWQAYPSEAPFLTRLDWAMDLVLAFRGSGMTYSLYVNSHVGLC